MSSVSELLADWKWDLGSVGGYVVSYASYLNQCEKTELTVENLIEARVMFEAKGIANARRQLVSLMQPFTKDCDTCNLPAILRELGDGTQQD